MSGRVVLAGVNIPLDRIVGLTGGAMGHGDGDGHSGKNSARDGLRMRVERPSCCTHVVVEGDVDISNVHQFQRALIHEVHNAAPSGRVIVNLEGVGFMGLRGVRALLAAARALEACGGVLRVMEPPRSVRLAAAVLDANWLFAP